MADRRKDKSDLTNLGVNHLENFFFVESDDELGYYYDLTDTLFVDTKGMNPQYYNEYDVQSGDTLYGLSKLFYENHNLWWVIAVANNIDDPFALSEMVGHTIKILKKPMVGQILTLIEEETS